MQRYEINNGTITKMIEVFEDPKRAGLLFSRHYDEKGRQIGSTWGKCNQAKIRNLIANGKVA